jgi:preprotein translocase subunit SecE
MANPLQFLQQVRQEARRVTWPTRRETLQSTGMVLLMVFVASLFFFGVDQVAAFVVRFILGMGRFA